MSPALAILIVFAVLLIASAVVVSYVQSRRDIENMRAVDALRKERTL